MFSVSLVLALGGALLDFCASGSVDDVQLLAVHHFPSELTLPPFSVIRFIVVSPSLDIFFVDFAVSSDAGVKLAQLSIKALDKRST
jgi:hypothetical protein